MSVKPYDMSMDKEEKGQPSEPIEHTFVIYDPERSAYERLQLCTYLNELPELTEADVEKYKDE